MSLNQSPPCGERTRPKTGVYELEPPVADVRKLLLKTLPVFIRVGTQQSSLISARLAPSSTLFDSRVHEYEYLVHLGTACCAFVNYLQPEKLSDEEAKYFGPQLSQLASLLDDLLDEDSIPSRPAEVRVS
jgi:hypothetical protein